MTLAKHAMLVRLSISQIGISGKDGSATIIANQALATGGNDAGYFRKFRIQKDDIAAITSSISKARSTHRLYTTPFGDDKWRMLPSTLVFKYTQEMRERRTDFEDAVEGLYKNWQAVVNKSQQVLGKLFNPNDYPDQSEIKTFFNFKTEFRPIPQTDHLLIQIEQETMEEIKKNIEKQNQEGHEASQRELWKRLYEPVKKMAEKLSDQDAIFHATLISNIQDIIQILPDLNVARDPKMNNLAREIEAKLCAFTAGQLREDKYARKQTAQEASALISKMDSFMGVTQ
jgi:hypothetical protein